MAAGSAFTLLAQGPGPEAEVAALVPPYIFCQGRLTGPTGSPVANGAYTMTFRLHNTAEGGPTLATAQEEMAASGLTMQATAGQAAVDVVSSANYRLEAGFWTAGEGARFDAFLPAVLRFLGLR